ncbi:hypothetical protein RXV95_14320 [Novosphingobium sp. ZN18A2]|uniref:Nmad3 family putative nucleotide modification protein n=1 Tax=Novosphingobium sp. ZN18A2 TaxID=3079861 RepID=UPI0030D16517
MKIVFSRKGFDSTAGRAPSPIERGRAISLPIPAADRSATRYRDIGHGKRVEAATRGRIRRGALCHDDPMFADGRCWFGQCGAAQGHLEKQGVRAGDVFVFFGLFADPESGERHHRIFGWMKAACTGTPGTVEQSPEWNAPPRPHPHLSGEWPNPNTIWHGPGNADAPAHDALRLTVPGGPLNLWRVPSWLRECGLSYHAKPQRWVGDGLLDSAKRGQEFVCDTGEREDARNWLARVIDLIEG